MKYYSLVLCGILLVVFILQQIPGFTYIFILSGQERWWTYFTSLFLHGDVMHLLSNMVALGIFGLIFEKNFGEKKLIVLFVCGGLVSSFVASFFYSSSLGASGAIFTIIGALAVTMPRLVVWALGVPMPMVVAAAVWMLLDVMGVFFPSNIANIAHLAGMAFGIMVGFVLREPSEIREPEKPLAEKEVTEWEKEWME